MCSIHDLKWTLPHFHMCQGSKVCCSYQSYFSCLILLLIYRYMTHVFKIRLRKFGCEVHNMCVVFSLQPDPNYWHQSFYILQTWKNWGVLHNLSDAKLHFWFWIRTCSVMVSQLIHTLAILFFTTFGTFRWNIFKLSIMPRTLACDVTGAKNVLNLKTVLKPSYRRWWMGWGQKLLSNTHEQACMCASAKVFTSK